MKSRSETMSLYQVSFPKDDAWEVMNVLGDLDCLHFLDMNSDVQPFNLPYASDLKRCEEVLRRIQAIEEECKNLKVPCQKLNDKKQIFTCFDSLVSKSQVSELKLFDKIEEEIRIKYEYVKSQQSAIKSLQETLEEQVRRKVILTSAASIIRGDREIRVVGGKG